MRVGRRAALGTVAAGLGALLIGRRSEAQQIGFEKIKRSGGDLLSWRWRSGEGREFKTSFTLSSEAIAEAETAFRDFNMDTMWKRLEADLRAEIERSGPGLQVKLTRGRDGIHWSINGTNQAAVDRLAATLKERLEGGLKAYLSRYLRMRVDTRVLVDFAAATTALQRSMRPVARALAATPEIPNTDRARIELALGFFQQIPYVQLEDNGRRGGDFLPAPALLAQNRGDCDSKGVALAAVLRTYTPGRKLVMVTMPGHAILAADLPSTPSDVAIRSDGRQYVALEVAGPAMAAVGQVGPTTARLLKEGREVEVWPLE